MSSSWSHRSNTCCKCTTGLDNSGNSWAKNHREPWKFRLFLNGGLVSIKALYNLDLAGPRMPIRWLKVGFGNLGFLFWCRASILGGCNQFITNKQGSYHMKPTQCQCTPFLGENPRIKMTPHRFATEVTLFVDPPKKKRVPLNDERKIGASLFY